MPAERSVPRSSTTEPTGAGVGCRLPVRSPLLSVRRCCASFSSQSELAPMIMASSVAATSFCCCCSCSSRVSSPAPNGSFDFDFDSVPAVFVIVPPTPGPPLPVTMPDEMDVFEHRRHLGSQACCRTYFRYSRRIFSFCIQWNTKMYRPRSVLKHTKQ